MVYLLEEPKQSMLGIPQFVEVVQDLKLLIQVN